MLRESRVAEWWPAAVFVGFVVAAAAVVAVLLVSGGRGELQRRSAQPQASARTTVAPSSTAPSCAPSGPQPTGERTLFDDLQPIELQDRWWQAWNRPESHAYRHGHMSILFCRQLYRDLEAFARDVAATKVT